jgi:mono/diheme cytochrome c family protein
MRKIVKPPWPVRPSRTALACGLLFALVGVAAPPAAPQGLFSATQDPIAGSRVFGAKGCGQCHAVRGQGGTVGPDLARIQRPRTFYDLMAALWNHAPRMVERMRQIGITRPRLDPREAGDLVAFLFTLDYFDRPGNVERGRRVYADKRCIVCHQVGGTGGVVGPSLDRVTLFDSPVALAAAMWNHGPQMSEAMRARGISRPTFNNTELLDLIAYITSESRGPRGGPLVVLPGRVEEGRRFFIEKRCVACHTAGGQGGRVAPDLAARAAHRSLTEFAAAMWNKAPAMTAAMKTTGMAVPELRPEEMADIVAYLYAIRYFAQAGDPKQGLALASAKGCFTCHALHGERGKPASDLARAPGTRTPAGVLAGLWNHSFIAEPERRPAAWPEFTGNEMSHLVAYLQSLRRAR